MEWLFGLIILILDIIAIVSVIGSRHSTGAKVLWILAIIIFPIVGMILYFLLGKKP